MKKIIVGFITVILSFSLFAIPSFAMTENEFIQYMKDKGFAQSYIVYAQNHFKSYDYTSAQLDTLKGYVDSTLAIVMPKNPEVVTKGGDYFKKDLFTDAEEDQILDNVVKAANALGIKAVVTRGPDTIRYVEFYDKNGKEIGSVTPKYETLKLTGSSFNPVYGYAIVLMLFGLLLAVGAIFFKKTTYLKKVS